MRQIFLNINEMFKIICNVSSYSVLSWQSFLACKSQWIETHLFLPLLRSPERVQAKRESNKNWTFLLKVQFANHRATMLPGFFLIYIEFLSLLEWGINPWKTSSKHVRGSQPELHRLHTGKVHFPVMIFPLLNYNFSSYNEGNHTILYYHIPELHRLHCMMEESAVHWFCSCILSFRK